MQFRDFIGELNSPLTVNGYMAAVMLFMNMIYRKDNLTREAYIVMMEAYLEEERSYLQDFNQYREFIKMKAPRTIRSYMYSIKNIIETCKDIEFTKNQNSKFKNLLRGTRKPITQDSILDHSMIRKILVHASPMARAVILIQLSSGIRIGELNQLRLTEFDMNNRSITIPHWAAKDKEQRTSFFTEEAAEALQMWLAYKPAYLERMKKQCVHIPLRKNDNVFNMSITSIREGVEKAIQGAGLKVVDKYTRRMTITTHSFRKFFITQLKLTMQNDGVEKLAGHELPYESAYFRMSDADMMKEYRKHEQVLYIGSDESVRTTLNNVDRNIAAVLMENKRLQEEVSNMKKDFVKYTMGKFTPEAGTEIRTE